MFFNAATDSAVEASCNKPLVTLKPKTPVPPSFCGDSISIVICDTESTRATTRIGGSGRVMEVSVASLHPTILHVRIEAR